MNVARIEDLGASAIAPQVRRIDAIRSVRDVADAAGYLSSIAAGGPFGGTIGIDPLNPGAPVVRLTQGDLLLPDRDYYLKVKPDDLIGNWQRALTFDNQYRLGNVAGTAGGEWVMPPPDGQCVLQPWRC